MLIDADLFYVEGPMTDDWPWHRAAQRAKEQQSCNIRCGLAGSDRDALAREFQRTTASSPAFRQAAS